MCLYKGLGPSTVRAPDLIKSLGLHDSTQHNLLSQRLKDKIKIQSQSLHRKSLVPCNDWLLLLYWSNPVSQVLRAMTFKRTTRGRSNFGELMTAKIS
jgi:hypothetical protein